MSKKSSAKSAQKTAQSKKTRGREKSPAKTAKKGGPAARIATKTKHRPLTAGEIRKLEASGCRAEDWKKVRVAAGFKPEALANVFLAGEIRLGAFAKSIAMPGGVQIPSGISGAVLRDCAIGDNVLIHNVGQYIANYDIGDDAVIDNVDCLIVEGETSFGNGTKVEALNEGGGREVKIYDRLTSQIAYLLALYRDRPDVVGALEKMIDDYVAKVTSSRGTVGRGARITNCGALVNLRVGPAAVIDGALRLANGTVNSEPAAPAHIGEGVIAEKFITTAGSKVAGGAMLTACFVGQGSKVGRQWSGENCLLFANCEAFHGEGVAIFGGPYTVTHHKSTLLIAGLFSFYNAGSGSNQSNHMYKLGPLHQGVLERGSKTGSFSYMLWSCRVGAFSAVIGKHYSKFDATDLPFSYIMEDKGGTVCVPAFNYFTVGTRRDGAKWPKRDRRETADKLDLIHFAVLNPYTAGRVKRGRELLRRLDGETQADAAYADHKGIKLPRQRLRRGADSYDTILRLYLGERLVARMESLGERAADLEAVLSAGPEGEGEWVDLCGLLAPAARVAGLLDDIAAGRIATIDSLEQSLRGLHGAMPEFEWAWVRKTWLAELGKTPDQVTVEDLASAVEAWQASAVKANDMILKDAHKEFGSDVKIGFGIDGDAAAVEADFAAIRGTFDDNSFVKELRTESAAIKERGGKLLARLR